MSYSTSYSMGLNAPYERRPQGSSGSYESSFSDRQEYNQRERDLLRELRDMSESGTGNGPSRAYSAVAKLNSYSTSEGASREVLELFPPPPKRYCAPQDRPTYKGDMCIPKKDALLVEMIMSDKATLKAQLDVTKQAIVGLDYVIEYIDPDSNIRIYECTLCKHFRAVQSIMEHLTGYNHRVNYIRKRFPSEVKMFLLPDGKHKNRNRALMIVANQRCGELELVYGRGDYQVKNEKPKMPEDALDAPENDLLCEDDDPSLAILKKFVRDSEKIKIESEEGMRLAKKITSTLTAAICEYKFNQKPENDD